MGCRVAGQSKATNYSSSKGCPALALGHLTHLDTWAQKSGFLLVFILENRRLLLRRSSSEGEETTNSTIAGDSWKKQGKEHHELSEIRRVDPVHGFFKGLLVVLDIRGLHELGSHTLGLPTSNSKSTSTAMKPYAQETPAFEVACLNWNKRLKMIFASYTEFLHYLNAKNRVRVAKFVENNTLFFMPPSDFLIKFFTVTRRERLHGMVLKFPLVPNSTPVQQSSHLTQYVQQIPPSQTEYSSIPVKDEQGLPVDYNRSLHEESKLLAKPLYPPIDEPPLVHSMPPDYAPNNTALRPFSFKYISMALTNQTSAVITASSEAPVATNWFNDFKALSK
ncbi:hypothetical protein VNO77_20203 [Canavalia gladiata]|uniref:Uncharacterized protein n=1 Tax=Canavalia gladiata TaxID=3824 RepID=A0AAN9QM74_CANGL